MFIVFTQKMVLEMILVWPKSFFGFGIGYQRSNPFKEAK
jgi:hypothetical protein